MAEMNNIQINNNDKQFESIGMKRDSGHKLCGYKFLFATLLWSGFMGQIGLPIVSGIMINTFRADGNIFGTLQVVSGILAIIFAAFAGSLQDSLLLQPLFDKLGCIRSKYGRRAPHILICIPLMSIPLLLVWHPPKWANVALNVDNSRKIIGANFTLNEKIGLDCSSNLIIQDGNGIIYQFNETLEISGDVVTGSTNNKLNLCESLVSDKSFCWPHPATNNEKMKRYCSFSDPSIAWHWFWCFVVGMWAFENINAAYISGSIEIYPWKEERLQLTSLGVIVAIFAVSVPVILSGSVQNNSEFGSKPYGGNESRWIAGIVLFITTYFGIGSVLPLRDARQPVKENPRWFIYEWIELLKTHDAMRWNFLNVIVSQVWQGLQAGLLIYYLNIVKLVPANIAGTGYILTVLVGLFTQIIAAVVWGFLFGTTSNKGREKSRNPRKLQLIGCALCALFNFICILLDPPTPRDETGSYSGMLIAYAFIRALHSPYDYWWNSVRGWQIDEDCHKLGLGTKRREGTIVSLLNVGIAIGSTIAVFIVSSIL